MNEVWIARSGAPVEVLTQLEDKGLGWFWLKRDENGQSTDVKRLDDEDADGNAAYQLPEQPNQPGVQPMYMRLRVLGAHGDGAPVMVDLRQNGQTLECKDSLLKTINAAPGGGYLPVQVGKISAGKNKTFKFDIWY